MAINCWLVTDPIPAYENAAISHISHRQRVALNNCMRRQIHGTSIRRTVVVVFFVFCQVVALFVFVLSFFPSSISSVFFSGLIFLPSFSNLKK